MNEVSVSAIRTSPVTEFDHCATGTTGGVDFVNVLFIMYTCSDSVRTVVRWYE